MIITNPLTCDIKNKQNRSDIASKNKYSNLPLLIIDLILLPIHIVRMILIYFWGSKYNLKGFTFLDVIMHADNPYFNQDDCRMIDTIGKDYRIVIRDDSRIFPLDICSKCEKSHEQVITGFTNPIITNSSNNQKINGNSMFNKIEVIESKTLNNDIWDLSTEKFQEDASHLKKSRKQKKKNSRKLNFHKLKVDSIDSKDTNCDSENSDYDSDSSTAFGSSSDPESDNMLTNDSTESNTTKNNSKNIRSEDANQIKGVNFFDDNDKSKNKKKKPDILDSIREELNSAFEIE